MSSPSKQPHLVSLVLQSKKALQHGELLCSRANSLAQASAQSAVDLLALDAKVRWITNAVLDQLKLAANVAKCIEDKRAAVARQVQTLDASRSRETDALDAMLESLGAQYVPPSFHQSSSASSIFGIQHTADQEDRPEPVLNGHPSPKSTNRAISISPSATVRDVQLIEHRTKKDRAKWKTLRDFVDDRAIEDVLETIESDRAVLETIVAETDAYPETLRSTTESIQRALPERSLDIMAFVVGALDEQDKVVASMAIHLESLASHYDQMASALRDTEAGEVLNEEDITEMNRDTDELPSIMAELEGNTQSVEKHHSELSGVESSSRAQLGQLQSVLDDLDELGEIMTEMLQRQDDVESRTAESIESIQHLIQTLSELRTQFSSYQTAFQKLVLEMARRRLYRESAENIVRGMASQLKAMVEEENQVREHFNAEYGSHLPEDICLYIANSPTKWEVVPVTGEIREVLPDVDEDLIKEAKTRLGLGERKSPVSSG